MTLLEKLIDHNRTEKIAKKLTISKATAESFLKKFGEELEDGIKKTICCLGIEQIDEEAEQQAVAEKLLIVIGKAIPSPYSIAWPLLKPVVGKIVLELIKQAAQQGEMYCKGVACTIIPFSIDL